MLIGAATMARNMASLIGATVKSLSWVDGIYLYDDGSEDNTAEVAVANSSASICVEKSTEEFCAFERGEANVRNHVIDRAFESLGCDILVIVDADELLSSEIIPCIEKIWREDQWNSIAVSTWHLYDCKSYLHFWETTWNNDYMIDPHVRIIKQGIYFEQFHKDGSHPGIMPTEKTLCLHGPYHFHLKYFSKSPYPNYALDFLPRRLTPEAVAPYRRPLPFSLHKNILDAINSIGWDNLEETDTPYYSIYQRNK